MYGKDVTEYGAVGDGLQDDSLAIQAALDSGQPLITIPYGVYKIGKTLRVNSNTRLQVHPQARIFMADGVGIDQNCFLLTNKHHSDGDNGIHVEGGIWDGNNLQNPRGPDQPDSYSGVLLNFSNVTDLSLRSMTLREPESYFIRFGKVVDFLVENITFQIRNLRPNQDGVHISGFCERGIVRQLRAFGPQTPNDDMVAILADDALQRAQNLGAYNGPIRDIRVEDIRADACHSFIRLLSYQNGIENIEINDVYGGCRLCAINMDACRDCLVKLFDEVDYPEGVGHISGVKVQNMHVYRASDHSHQPLLDFRTRVQDFVIRDFRRDYTQDISPDTPTLRMTQANSVDLVLEGLTAYQLAGTIDQSSSGIHDSTNMASLYEQEIYRGMFTIEPDDNLILPDGSFSLLQANHKS